MAIVTAEDAAALVDRIVQLEAALRPFAGAFDSLEGCLDLIEDGYDNETVKLCFGGMEADQMDIEDFRAADAAYYPKATRRAA